MVMLAPLVTLRVWLSSPQLVLFPPGEPTVSLPRVILVVAVIVMAAAEPVWQMVTSYSGPLGTTPQLQLAGSVQPPEVVRVHEQAVCAAKVGRGKTKARRRRKRGIKNDSIF